ncbi:MAG: hypothetical protein ACFB0B_19870 [Thermonemataceae bacterium]
MRTNKLLSPSGLYKATFIVVFFCLWLLRVWKLWQVGLFDYDSAKNYLILTELYNDNFHNFFHHASPGFYLFYFLCYLVTPNYLVLEVITALFATLSIFIFASYVPIKVRAWFCLLLGTSFFLMASSRYFAIESLSLLLFSLFVKHYFHSYTKRHQRLSGLLLGLLFTVNYKAILVIFFVLLYELGRFFFFKERRYLLQNSWVIVLPSVGFMLLGLAFQLPFLRYPATIYHIFWQPTYIQSGWQDYLFYFKYLLHFEHIILLPLLLVGILTLINKPSIINSKVLYFIVCTFLILIVMSFLPKAPRGILFLYPVFYFIVFYVLERYLSSRWYWAFILVSVSIQLYRFDTHVYNYAKSEYQGLQKIVTQQAPNSISSWIIPPLKPLSTEIPVTQVVKNSATAQRFMLLSCFPKIATLPSPNFTSEYKVIWQGYDLNILQPMVFLESAEFTGRTYEECWAAQRRLLKDSCTTQLIIY